jgi:MFS family permease
MPPLQVGDLLFWILMFICGTEFITADFMTHEPKILFCDSICSCIGSVLIAVLADRCGRRPAMLLAMVTMATGAVFETFMPLLMFSFLKSFGKRGLFQVSLVSGRVSSFPTLATRST